MLNLVLIMVLDGLGSDEQRQPTKNNIEEVWEDDGFPTGVDLIMNIDTSAQLKLVEYLNYNLIYFRKVDEKDLVSERTSLYTPEYAYSNFYQKDGLHI